jgi:hypothetical protein
MIKVDARIGRRCTLLGIAAVTLLTACATGPAGSTPGDSGGGTASGTASASSPATTRHLGPQGYGALTPGISEQDALAGGDLHTAPISTVDDEHYYSFVGGPAPDPALMAEEQRLERAVIAAERDPLATEEQRLKAQSELGGRLAARLAALDEAGGAVFWDGTLHRVVVPAGVTTAEGITRGSTLQQLQAAYGDGMKRMDAFVYALPMPGHDDWSVQFTVEDATVRHMAFGRETWPARAPLGQRG